MIELNRFKDGKIGAVTLSYDDGTTYDKQLIEILDRYQMKATFHINSEFFGTEGKIPADEAEEIFRGHEVAVPDTGSRHSCRPRILFMKFLKTAKDWNLSFIIR